MRFSYHQLARVVSSVLLAIAFLVASAATANPESGDGLTLSAYCTAGTAQTLLKPENRAGALATLEKFGIDRIVIESNRGDRALSESDMVTLRDYFTEQGYAVAAGMATVPGGDWGIRANEGLAWMNYQHPKTQVDIEAAVRAAARVFDTVVIDDFLMSGDKSPLSDQARRGRDWGPYRRDLMTALSQRMIIGPAKEENPDVKVVIKYPQSYDRYHNFGYDTEREPQLYDEVWVGTETRGQYTQRFGFTQPYEGFVNYRWIESLARGRMAAAWFDHGDCDGPSFVEQAWQTVLAGANEIVLFNFANLQSEHPGHALLLEDMPKLKKLAAAVAEHPVTGVRAYKPPNSDPVTDMYAMDFVGMLGVPLVPVSGFPADAQTVFLPAHAAKDGEIVDKIEQALAEEKNVVITTGLLASVPEGGRLANLAGVAGVPSLVPARAETVLVEGEAVAVPRGLDLAGELVPVAADVVLEAVVNGKATPYLTEHHIGAGRLSVWNLQMFTQADFEAANEVLLSPRNLGMLDMPQAWANTLRKQLGGGGEVLADAPTRVTFQPLGESGWFVQNYNNEAAHITLGGPDARLGKLSDGFAGEPLVAKGNVLQHEIPARSRLWVAR